MAIELVESLDDPRLWPYGQLKERELARQGDRFIAEGEYVVRRLLASAFAVESVLLARRRADEIAPLIDPTIPVYVLPDALMPRLLGFRFHSGVIACGRRRPSADLTPLLAGDHPRTFLVCPEISNTENLGSLIRIGAGFGIDAMILGEHSCDPFFRQAIRVSMGTVFSLPIVRSDDLAADLRRMRAAGVELAATVLDESAEPLRQARRGPRLALLMGNEAQGLRPRWLDLCDRRITIPMKLGTDSLNVSVAAGIFLWHFGG